MKKEDWWTAAYDIPWYNTVSNCSAQIAVEMGLKRLVLYYNRQSIKSSDTLLRDWKEMKMEMKKVFCHTTQKIEKY